MLKELTTLNGVSGKEGAVREYIKNKVAPYADEIITDKMGNLIAIKKGKSNTKRFMICAHMDEVGFIVKGITDDGFLKFAEVGGIDARLLVGKRVYVGENGVTGVLGIKAVHMTTAEERKTPVKMKDMYIDIGCDSKEEAEKKASLGDYIYFDSEYVEFGNNKIKAKALDDRVGCANLIRIVEKLQPEYDTYFVFTVQEEVGLRGAKTAAKSIMPDAALILEGTICADTCDAPESAHVSTMGKGPVLSIMERSSRSDIEFVKMIENTAKTADIPYQFKRTGAGGNDAGAIQVTGGGVKTAVISVPCRYIHSAVSVIDKTDFENTYKLALAVCKNIGGII